MEIWLDTCNIKGIQAAQALGITFGITTNPSILASGSESPEKIIANILEIQNGPIAVQVTPANAKEICERAIALRAFSNRIIVKVPVTTEGLIAIRTLSQEKIPVMATAVFDPRQTLLATLAGAAYVAPYVGRMFDEGIEAYTALESMVKILDKYGRNTKIIAAALRTTDQIMACAALGVDAVTIKTSLFQQFISDDPMTLESLNAFSIDWEARNHREDLLLQL